MQGLLPNQVHFARCTASQNSEAPRFATRRGFICKAAKRWEGRTNLKCTWQEQGAWGMYGIRNTDTGQSEAWAAWGEVRSSVFCAGVIRLPLAHLQKVPGLSRIPSQGPVVLPSLNRLRPDSAQQAPRPWKAARANVVLFRLRAAGGPASLEMSLISEGRWNGFNPGFQIRTEVFHVFLNSLFSELVTYLYLLLSPGSWMPLSLCMNLIKKSQCVQYFIVLRFP